MLLETARRYNHETECITFLKDFTYSKDDFHRAGMVERGLGGCRTGAPAESLLLGDLRPPRSCLSLHSFISKAG